MDFSNADLSFSTFDFCDLQGALFDSTNLDRSDFRTAHHYSIDPENNRIKKAQFSLNGIIGLLDKYDIEIDEHTIKENTPICHFIGGKTKLFKENNDLAVLKKIQECKIPVPSSINPNVPKEI